MVVKDGVDLGACKCDLKQGSCDPSCCCDTDCPEEVLDLWVTNSDVFCNSLVSEIVKPRVKCINKGILFRSNDRMGLQMTTNEIENLFCVESDGSTSLNFREKIADDYDMDSLFSMFQESDPEY